MSSKTGNHGERQRPRPAPRHPSLRFIDVLLGVAGRRLRGIGSRYADGYSAERRRAKLGCRSLAINQGGLTAFVKLIWDSFVPDGCWSPRNSSGGGVSTHM